MTIFKHNKIYFFLCLILMLLLILFWQAFGQSQNYYKRQTGEILNYKVKWGFIRLGTVSLETKGFEKIDSYQTQHIQFRIESNPLLFFVNMHSVFDCYLDSTAMPVRYIASEKVDGKNRKAVYNFNYADSQFTIDFYHEPDTLVNRKVCLPLHEPVFDGISLITFSRMMISKKRHANVLAFMDTDLGRVELNYAGRSVPIKIRALMHKVPTYYVSGIIRMKGIAGVTGPFEGWFASDAQRPPLKARLKVFIGNVEVELESWQKWDPN